jgi:CRP-like cAMP-binding protein
LTDYRAQLGDQIADADPLRSGRVGVRPNSNGNLRTPDDATERLLSKYRENRLLCVMAADDLAGLQPNLKKFSMAPGAVLHAPGQPIEHVYFPVSGMVSLLAVMRTGEQIETATIGREGVLGASIGCDGTESVGQAMVQIEGIAWQLQTSKFLEMYQASATFRTLMNRFQNLLLLQAQQWAACHALHTVTPRLCRWLLQSQDITQSDMVPLTQDALSHVLGVRRTTVTSCARALQTTGLIQYRRGHIKILNRDGLKDLACECYEAHSDRERAAFATIAE